MTESLRGVIIGGLIGGFFGSYATLITLTIEYRKWKRDKRIAFLREKKEKLELKYGKIAKNIASGSYSYDVLPEFMMISEDVCEAIKNWLVEEKNEEKRLSHFSKITSAMEKSLKEIDDKIQKEIN